MQMYLLLLCFALACHTAYLQEGGRNSGEPDYNGLADFELRSNDEEPDYDPEGTLQSFERELGGKLLNQKSKL